MAETNPSSDIPHILGSEYVARLPTRRLSQIAMGRRECVICHKPLTESSVSRTVRAECCVSVYHDQCLLEWCGENGANKESCPYCRRRLFRRLHSEFVPGYRFNPHDGLWRNGNGLTVTDQHVSDYIVYTWELETEEWQDGYRRETGQTYEEHPNGYDGVQFIYGEGRWWDLDDCEVFPHKVHDFLTGGWDDLGGQRVAAVWDRTHNNLETPE